jgi:hypothetical protein
LIPMESMEGRYVEGMHRQLVKSAAEANMNMLRVPTPSKTRVQLSLSFSYTPIISYIPIFLWSRYGAAGFIQWLNFPTRATRKA